MRIVVTGGAGFIGSNLVRELLREGHQAVVLDDFSTGLRENLSGLDVELYDGSILDSQLLKLAFAGADSVIHLAAIPSVPRSVANPLRSHEANATGTVLVLEAARDVGCHVVVASSSSVYGANPQMPKVETMVPMPRSPYAASKLATESYALAWQAAYGLPTVAFRFFNVYGPRQAAGHAYAAVVPAFVDRALSGRPLVVYGDGQQTRDFTNVDSVTKVLLAAATGFVTSDTPVNLAFGSRRSLLEVIAELESLLGHPLEVEFAPERPGDVRDSQADNGLLLRLFPEAVPIPFRDGLASTVEWMRSGL